MHAPPLAEGQDPGTQQRAPWLAGVFDGSSRALREGLDSLCSFIGIKARAFVRAAKHSTLGRQSHIDPWTPVVTLNPVLGTPPILRPT